jgi:acetyl-CoA carboxylase biotin carboxyl carrier protein
MAETKVVAEMTGRILSFSVSEGDKVEPGQEIALLEAMKMEIPLTSPVGGTIAGMLCQPDDMVSEGDPVLVVKVG